MKGKKLSSHGMYVIVSFSLRFYLLAAWTHQFYSWYTDKWKTCQSLTEDELSVSIVFYNVQYWISLYVHVSYNGKSVQTGSNIYNIPTKSLKLNNDPVN